MVSLISRSTIFGSTHCIAWNFAFQTDVEKLLWTMSSLLTIIIPLMLTVLSSIIGDLKFEHLGSKKKETRPTGLMASDPRAWVFWTLTIISGIAYTLARIGKGILGS
jgi:hypothetical protein